MTEDILIPTASASDGRSRKARVRSRPFLLRDLRLSAKLDLVESLRSHWFFIYTAVFGGGVALLFAFGLTESRILGFIGLSRLLVTYVQLCMAILPVFILVTTVRSVAGDREAGIYEYLLSLPVSLKGWYWGKFLGRFVVVFLPVAFAMGGAAVWARWDAIPVSWSMVGIYTLLLAALTWCFLGIGMGISAMARNVDVAQGAAFVVWIVLVLFLDLVLLGVLIQEQVRPELAIGIALVNPLQTFRTAALVLFDPDLILLGPAAFVIFDAFGRTGFLAWSILYPTALGSLCAGVGFFLFQRRDLP